MVIIKQDGFRGKFFLDERWWGRVYFRNIWWYYNCLTTRDSKLILIIKELSMNTNTEVFTSGYSLIATSEDDQIKAKVDELKKIRDRKNKSQSAIKAIIGGGVLRSRYQRW